MSRDTFGCHAWERRGDPGTEWEESRGAANRPAVCRTASQPRLIQPQVSVMPRLRDPDLQPLMAKG